MAILSAWPIARNSAGATGGPFRAHRLYVLFIAQLCECLLVVVDFDAIYDPVFPFRAKLYVDGDTNLYAAANLIVC